MVFGSKNSRGPGYDRPPSPAQIRYITVLCMKLGIREPMEEKVRYDYEADRIIKYLKGELKKRPKLRGG